MDNNFQRLGSISNTHVGRDFEEAFIFRSLALGEVPPDVQSEGFALHQDRRIITSQVEMLHFSVCPQHYRRILLS